VNKQESRLARDDEPPVMSMDERATWVQLIFTAITGVGYLIAVAPQAMAGPIEDVDWLAPMLWAIGITIIGVIIGSIMAGIGGAIGLTLRGRNVDAELASDFRDKAIENHSRLRTYWMLGAIFVTMLVLLAFEVDHFWIASALFVGLSIQTITAQVIKIRSYRRGFVA
jgi:hypothetical protein